MAADTRIGSPASCFRKLNSTGFTLIELMIVVSIIGILASIAVPSYQSGLIKAREAVLRENLYSIRSAIDQLHADQGRYPDSLQELVDRKYLRELPKDPFTNKNNTWIIVAPLPDPGPKQGSQLLITSSNAPLPPQGNVYDIHSGSNLVGTNGTPYNEW